MIDYLLEPFAYGYMTRAILVCALVGGVCAFLSSFLVLKGWSLMGDALSHSIVPGVAIAYIIGFPYAVGAFFSGLIAAAGMTIIRTKTKLREDAVIGIVFSTLFSAGLLLASFYPVAVNLQSIILGNIMGISDGDLLQVVIISLISIMFLLYRWKDLMLVFFDENHARSMGISVDRLKILFFTVLSAATVAALQTVGACLVIAMVVTPGATAYLLTDRFGRMITIATIIGAGTSAVGAYLSYHLDTTTGGLIVLFQTIVFLGVWIFSPRHGLLRRHNPMIPPVLSEGH